MPVIAILRGITPRETAAVAAAILRAGVRIIEVPLNSPEPFESIRRLCAEFADRCLIGAGTVVDVSDVDKVVEAGGRLIVSPNTDVEVIARTLANAAVSLPGVATATEALQACAAGARYLKLFPASSYGVSHVRALRAVLPTDVQIVGVGGIGAGNAREWMSAGLCGVGIGTEIYRAGEAAESVFDNATAVVDALRPMT